MTLVEADLPAGVGRERQLPARATEESWRKVRGKGQQSSCKARYRSLGRLLLLPRLHKVSGPPFFFPRPVRCTQSCPFLLFLPSLHLLHLFLSSLSSFFPPSSPPLSIKNKSSALQVASSSPVVVCLVSRCASVSPRNLAPALQSLLLPSVIKSCLQSSITRHLSLPRLDLPSFFSILVNLHLTSFRPPLAIHFHPTDTSSSDLLLC
ncbi:hypothetical protein J3F83DRAFT_646621 [Trichoderma novae-zelandiae]